MKKNSSKPKKANIFKYQYISIINVKNKNNNVSLITDTHLKLIIPFFY